MRKPIQQLGMARRLRAQAKITWRSDQSRAEVAEPDAIDHDARGQWIFGRGDGSGEFEASTAFLKRLSFCARDDLQELTRHLIALSGRIAANKHTWISFRLSIVQYESMRRSRTILD